MKNHILVRWVIGMVLLVTALMLIIIFHEPEKEGISRAVAAKSLALAVLSPEELIVWQKKYGASHFDAETLDEWYAPYMDYLYEEKIADEEEIPADAEHAEGELTYREASDLARALSPELGRLIKATGRNSQKPYPEKLWWLFYDSVLKELDPYGRVEKKAVMVYGTPDNIPGAPPWTAYTNLGELKFNGLTLFHLLDHELTVLIRGNELIGVMEDRGETPIYRNVWIMGGDENLLSVFLGDVEREIPFKKKFRKIDGLTGHLADVWMDRGQITKISLKTETITGKILSVQQDVIELEGYGTVPLDEEVKVLKVYGDVKRKKLSDVLVGYSMEEFVVANGKICAVLTVREFEADTIRVLIMNDQFQGLYHDSLTIQSDGPFVWEQGKERHEEARKTEFMLSSGDAVFKKGRVILTPETGRELRVTSLARTQGTPAYGGRLEVLDTEEGLVLINELYLEEYLKKVVPSEMPAGYQAEALKAQAVCARTYAYMQIQSNTYRQYGAQVDDSTNFQVYNNITSDTRTDDAVQQTYGKLLLYEGAPISAFYFSTSCGTTTDGSVWGGEPEKTPYLESIALQPGRKQLQLTDNADFAAFIKKTDYPAYDSAYPFYRWNVTTNTKILTAKIGDVGEVQNIQITQRGPGGVAQELLVNGKEGEKTISGQNAIRSALGDTGLVIWRNDGKQSEGWSSLPSGFLAIEDLGADEEGGRRFKIYGGGYGHGVGMSQNGAQKMAESGMEYGDILKFFYAGVAVDEMNTK